MNAIQIIDELITEMGVDVRNVYCAHLGRPIGRISEDEIADAISMMTHTDPDDIKSELLTRCLAFARPSPSWGYMTLDTLEHVRVNAPIHLFAYLLNRLYEPIERESQVKMTHENRMANILSRIRMWQVICSLDITPEQLNPILLVLLELDARVGLHKMAPLKSLPLIPDWFTPNGFAKLMTVLNSWRDTVRKSIEESERKASLQTRWERAPNRLVQKPFVSAFWEAQPPSQKKAKAQAKQKDRDMLSALFDQIMSDSGDTPVPTLTAIASVPKGLFKPGNRPTFGVKRA